MSEEQAIAAKQETFGSRVTKSLILFFWILSLIVMAFAAQTQYLSNTISMLKLKVDSIAIFKTEPVSTQFSPIVRNTADLSDNKWPQLNIYQELNSYLETTPNSPPIQSILHLIDESTSYKWSARYPGIDHPDSNSEKDAILRDLFGGIEMKLLSIMQDPSANLDGEFTFDIPVQLQFSDEFPDDFPISLKLPNDVSDWIIQQRENERISKRQEELLDVFATLIVLGAFGSMIFLVKNHMDPSVIKSYSTYVFHPILGMLLALAMFVLDVFIFSITTQSEISELNTGPLYLAAFAAGLMSDKVYALINERLYNTLEKKSE